MASAVETEIAAVKRCPRCESTKPAEAFARDRTRKDGRQAICRECRRAHYDGAYQKSYKAEHRERLAAANRARPRDRDAERIRLRAWYDANRDIALERAAEWNRVHPERRDEIRSRWLAANPEKAQVARWVNRNNRRGARPTGTARKYTEILKGDPCAYCGAPMEEIDHITPVALGGPSDWSNLTPACGPCNRFKHRKPLLSFLLARS